MQFEIKLYFLNYYLCFFLRKILLFSCGREAIYLIYIKKKHLTCRSQFQLLNMKGKKKWGSQN